MPEELEAGSTRTSMTRGTSTAVSAGLLLSAEAAAAWEPHPQGDAAKAPVGPWLVVIRP